LLKSTALKTAFLDRDGVVNIDKGYVHQIADFEFTQDFFHACHNLALQGYRLVIVTNQSGIARGYYTEQDFAALNQWLISHFTANNLVLDAIYHCPHGVNDGCTCRKPLPGMVKQHLALTGAAPQDCIMFGDKISDQQCAQAAGLGQYFMIDVTANPRHFFETVQSFLSANSSPP
jgi:D-glycero-D-manno-heptose 1,7-bisphosphate phosphatase